MTPIWCPNCQKTHDPSQNCTPSFAYDYGEGGAQPVPPSLETQTFVADVLTTPASAPIVLKPMDMAGMTQLALDRGHEVLRLRDELASVTKERDHYKNRIDVAIRKLEGW